MNAVAPARADLRYERTGERTLLARCEAAAPLRVPPPVMLGACAYTTLLNVSGGLVGGDDLRHRIALGPRAHALLTTASAGKVYRSAGSAARSIVEVEVGPGAILEWVPDPIIVYAGAKLHQTLRVEIAPGGTAIVSDLWSGGRLARGERWAHARLNLALEIDFDGRPLVRERAMLGPDRDIGLEGWSYRGAWYAVTDRPCPWSDLADDVAGALDSVPDIYAGASPLARGAAISLVARTAPAFAFANALIWSRVRCALLGEAPPALRKH